MYLTSEPTPKHKTLRKYSQELKAKILHDCNQPDTSIAAIAIKNQINPNLIHKWRRINTSNQNVQPDFIPLHIAQPHLHSL
ncbi:MAG: transposase [Pseudomonadales bacterium]|nr:transposase [Pseudomonadales bacterium]